MITLTNAGARSTLDILGSDAPMDAGLSPSFQSPWMTMQADAEKAQRERRASQLEKLDAALLDPESFFKKNPFEPQFTTDADKAKRRVLVSAALRVENGGKPLPMGADGHELMRRRVAATRFQGRGAEDDDAFHAELVKDATRRKDGKELGRELAKSAFNDAMMPATSAGGFKAFREAVKRHAGYDPTREADYWEQWTATRLAAAETIAEFKPALDAVWNAFETEGDVGKAARDAYSAIPDHADRMRFMTALRLRAEKLAPEAQPRFWSNVGKQSERDITAFGRDALAYGQTNTAMFDDLRKSMNDPLYMPGPQDIATRERLQGEDAATRREIDFIADVRAVQESTFDPVKHLAPDGSWTQAFERGAYGIPGAAVTSLAAAVPGVGMATFYASSRESIYQQYRRDFEASGMDYETASKNADAIAPVAALPQVLMEKLQLKAFAGKLPMLENVMQKAAGKFTSRTGQFAMRAGVGAIEEGILEKAQDLVPAFVQDVAHGLQADIPDVNWSDGKNGVLDGFWKDSAALVVTMLPLAIFGAGHGVVRDQQRITAVQAASDKELLALGATPADISSVRMAGNFAEQAQAVETMVGNLDPQGETAKAATDELKAQQASQARASADLERLGYASPRFIQTQDGISVVDSVTGDEIGQAPDLSGAIRIARTHTMAIDDLEADQVAALGSLMEAARAAAELDPNSVVDVGFNEVFDPAKASPKQAARFAAQVALKEEAEGGTGDVARSILGNSETTFAQGLRTTVNRIYRGGSVLTVFHETFHGLRRQARTAGTITRADEIALLRGLDQVLANRTTKGGTALRFIPENMTDDQVSDTLLDEAISEIAEMELLRTRKGAGKGKLGVSRGVISRNLSALARLIPGVAGKFSAFLRAVRAHWGLSLSRAVALKAAERRGEFDASSYQGFLDTLLGLDAQQAHDDGVRAELNRIMALPEFDPTDDIPFSIGGAGGYTVEMERDLAKSIKDRLLEKPSEFLPSATPRGVLEELKKWPVVSKSPYSDSLYDITNKSWGPDPDGHLRMADHWNYVVQDSLHGRTDYEIPSGQWALAKKDEAAGIYRILKVWGKGPDVGRIRNQVRNAKKAKITPAREKLLLLLADGPVEVSGRMHNTFLAWHKAENGAGALITNTGTRHTDEDSFYRLELTETGKAVVQNGKIDISRAEIAEDGLEDFPDVAEIPLDTLKKNPLPSGSAVAVMEGVNQGKALTLIAEGPKPEDSQTQFGTDASGFSIGPADVPAIMEQSALSRIRDPRRRTQAMQRIARDFNSMRLQIDRLLALSGRKRSKAELRQEANAREDLRAEELIADVHRRFGSILHDEDLTKIKSQPVHAWLADPNTPLRGRLMSKAAAIKAHPERYQLHRGGEYDGSEGVSRSVFGGQNMPDQMAQELFDHGLISEPTPDAMWEALAAEQNTVARNKEFQAKAMEQIREAKAEAKREATEWLNTQGKDQETTFNPREEILRSLRMLDAILLAMPPEVRGKVGGYTQMARITTDEAKLSFLKDKLAKADKELEIFLRAEFGKEFEDLMKRARPSKDAPGERPSGNIDPDAWEIFKIADAATHWKFVDAEAEATKYDTKADHEDTTPEDSVKFRAIAQVIRLVQNWEGADAARREMAVKELEGIFYGGLDKLRRTISARMERVGILRNSAQTGTAKAGHRMEIKDAKKQSGKLAWEIMSFGQVVNVLFGEDSTAARWFNSREIAASNALEDSMQVKVNALESLFETLAGSRFAGEKLRHRMQSEESITVTDALGVKQTFTESEAITFLLMWRQEDGARHMRGMTDEQGNVVSSWAWDESSAADVEQQLSPAGQQMLAFLGDSYGEEYDRINDVFRRIWHVSMPRHKMYAPLTVKATQAKADTILDPVSGDTMGVGMTPGSLKNRSQTAVAEPDFRDAFQVYLTHARQMEHFIAYGEFARDAMAIVNRRDTRNAIEAAGGSIAMNTLGRWLDFFAMGGIRDANMGSEWMQTAGRMLGRLSQAALVGRVSVLAMQSLQLAAATYKMPLGAFLTRFVKLQTGQLSWGDAIRSPYIQRRLAEMPPVVRDLIRGMEAGTPNRLKFLAAKGGRTIAGADALFTAGTYAIFYDYHLKQNGGDVAAAHAEAERLTDQVAQPTRSGARSMIELANSGNPAFRALWNFSSDPRQKASIIVYEMMRRDKKGGEKAAAAGKAIAITWGVSGILQAVLRAVLRDLRSDEDDEIFDERHWNLKRLALQAATGPLGAMPFFGEMIEGASYKATGTFMPGGSLLDSLGDAVGLVPKWMKGNFDLLEDAEKLFTGGAVFSGTSAASASGMHVLRDAWNFIDNLTD